MVLSVATAVDVMRHAVGELSPEIGELMLLNQAGRQVNSWRKWKHKRRREAYLPTRAKVPITGAVWSQAVNALAATGAFANYEHEDGDQVRVTAGTGATLGYYEVASKSDNDTIILSSKISALDLVTGDIEAEIVLDSINIRATVSDFDSIISVKSVDLNTGWVEPSSLEEVLEVRSLRLGRAGTFLYAVAFRPPTAGGPEIPYFEVAPAPTTNNNAAYAMIYRAGWLPVVDDANAITIPEHLEALYLETLVAFALGYERREDMPLGQRLAQVRAGDTYKSAARHDARIQPMVGTIRNGVGSPMSIFNPSVLGNSGGPA